MPLSFSGGAIATSAIGRDLGGSAAMLTWITNAIMLTFGGLLLTAGTLADRFGRKRIFAGGILLFVADQPHRSSRSRSSSSKFLRALQAIGAAAALAGGSAASAAFDLEFGPDRPDVFGSQRRLCPGQLSLFHGTRWGAFTWSCIAILLGSVTEPTKHEPPD